MTEGFLNCQNHGGAGLPNFGAGLLNFGMDHECLFIFLKND
jgi:hypothetical protein